VSNETPSQTVGPYFAYGLLPHIYARRSIATHQIAKPETPGEHIRIAGRVLDGNGAPIEDAMLEVWQADSEGRYASSADPNSAMRSDSAFRGFGRTGTTSKGEFVFETIKPGRLRGTGNALQAPHLNLIVFSRGLLTHVYTRIYFDDEQEANSEDEILNLVEKERRPTLIAKREKDGVGAVYRFDIFMQGENETVFLEA
jgi:protocatechuate 3,4-dioxygenase alpha subunit